MDQIIIEDLQVYAYHGVYPEEKALGQNFFLNAALEIDTGIAGRSDELKDSVNYGEVCHFMDRYMKEHTYRLLEAAAERLARALLVGFPLIRRLTLELRKPEAPIGLPLRSVSVRIVRGWTKAYVALGSNMGDREQTLCAALEAMGRKEEIRLNKASDFFRTTPYGVEDQEEFLNGAAELETLFTPIELLNYLQELEQAAGRERKLRWGPRTLDLDILFYGNEIMNTDVLTIPHPDMENRDFVLVPMLQLAPGLEHPAFHKTIRELNEGLQERGGYCIAASRAALKADTATGPSVGV